MTKPISEQTPEQIEHQRALQRARYKTGPAVSASLRWRAAHPEWVAAYTKKYRARPETQALMKEAVRRRLEKNPDFSRENHLRRKYGLSLAEYRRLETAQGGLCAICRKPEKRMRGSVSQAPRAPRILAVDHCHETNRVRGLLCHDCNTALGLFAEDPSLLSAAVAYLTRHLIEPRRDDSERSVGEDDHSIPPATCMIGST